MGEPEHTAHPPQILPGRAVTEEIRRFAAAVAHRRLAVIGRLMGTAAYGVDVRHRRIVRRNLRFAFPEWPWAAVHRTTRRVFQNFGITLLETLQSTAFTREELLQRVRVDETAYRSLLTHANGAILITAHLGNWEMAFQFGSCLMEPPPVAVARPIAHRGLDQWVHRMRTRFGGAIITKKGALPEMTQVLRNGRLLVLLIDQGLKATEGVTVTFFGRKVTATSAVAMLAMRCKSAVAPVFCVRAAKGLQIVIKPALELQRSGNLRDDIVVNTQLMYNAIEGAIREYPDQWFWFHKRWKVHYPHLYREDLERKRRSRERQRRKRQAGGA
jgi:KDO2-lipid IV(A) lauroyltransferase